MLRKRLEFKFIDFFTKKERTYELAEEGRILTAICPIDKTILLHEYNRSIFCPNCNQTYSDTYPKTLEQQAKQHIKMFEKYLKETESEITRIKSLLETASKNGFH